MGAPAGSVRVLVHLVVEQASFVKDGQVGRVKVNHSVKVTGSTKVSRELQAQGVQRLHSGGRHQILQWFDHFQARVKNNSKMTE